MLKKMLPLVALLSPLLAAPEAMALDTSHTYKVRFDGLRVGTWTLRNRVVETPTACTYTIRWSDLSGPPLSRTALCRIDELKAGDNLDCEMSRRGFFDTVVRQSKCGPCQGFDDFGQQTKILHLIAGEDSEGSLNGVVTSNSVGDVQNLEVE